MAIDRLEPEPKIEQDEPGDEMRAQRLRLHELKLLELESSMLRRLLDERSAKERLSHKSSRLKNLKEGTSPSAFTPSSNEGLRLLDLSSSDVDIRPLAVELAHLRAQVLNARRVEDQLRNGLAMQAASHATQLSKLHDQAAQYRADIAQYQAENADLRRENEVITEDLTEARRKLGDEELEIYMLRSRLGLEQRPSPFDIN